jgi:hypothetical protein
MALQSEGLYHAALAIAANTLNLSDQRYRLPALEHHHQALNYLRVLLNQNTWLEREMDEMLGLVLMLCWFDVRTASLFSFALTMLILTCNRYQMAVVLHGSLISTDSRT